MLLKVCRGKFLSVNSGSKRLPPCQNTILNEFWCFWRHLNRTLVNVGYHLISFIFTVTPAIVVGSSRKTSVFTWPNKKKSHVVRSGKRTRHEIGLPLSKHRFESFISKYCKFKYRLGRQSAVGHHSLRNHPLRVMAETWGRKVMKHPFVNSRVTQ